MCISSLEDKGYRIAFVDGKVLAWKKDSSFESSKIIGVCIGGLYNLLGRFVQALLHNTTDLCELWHQMYAHAHYKALSRMRNCVNGVPKIMIDHDGICKGCALGKNVRGRFSNSDTKDKDVLDLIHFDICGPMLVKSLGGHLYYVKFIDDYS